jgi:V/A-type H+-transporting ATPase subunit C
MPPIGTGIRHFVESFRYAYPSTRARALKSFLLTDKQFNKIADSVDLNESAAILRGTIYGPALSGKNGLLEIEVELNKNLAETLRKISDFLPTSSKAIFQRYLEKYEAENIKALIIGVGAKIPKIKIMQMITPLYIHLHAQQYDKLASSKEIWDVISALSGTPYHFAMSQAYKEYERSRSTLPFDSALDLFIYQRIFETISTSTGGDVGSLKKMIGVEVDVKNIKSILRLRSSMAQPVDVMRYLIPRGYRLNLKTLEHLSGALDIEELISRLQKTRYHDYLYSANKYFEKAKKEKRLTMLENALDELLEDIGLGFDRDYPLGIGPILGYVIAKTIEVKKLIAILKLKDEGYSKNKIDEILGNHGSR